MGRVLDGIRLSGMLRSEIALVLRKEQLHIFLCFHQLLHLVPCLAVGIIDRTGLGIIDDAITSFFCLRPVTNSYCRLDSINSSSTVKGLHL